MRVWTPQADEGYRAVCWLVGTQLRYERVVVVFDLSSSHPVVYSLSTRRCTRGRCVCNRPHLGLWRVSLASVIGTDGIVRSRGTVNS
jgi:hypothetical protein